MGRGLRHRRECAPVGGRRHAPAPSAARFRGLAQRQVWPRDLEGGATGSVGRRDVAAAQRGLASRRRPPARRRARRAHVRPGRRCARRRRGCSPHSGRSECHVRLTAASAARAAAPAAAPTPRAALAAAAALAAVPAALAADATLGRVPHLQLEPPRLERRLHCARGRGWLGAVDRAHARPGPGGREHRQQQRLERGGARPPQRNRVHAAPGFILHQQLWLQRRRRGRRPADERAAPRVRRRAVPHAALPAPAMARVECVARRRARAGGHAPPPVHLSPLARVLSSLLSPRSSLLSPLSSHLSSHLSSPLSSPLSSHPSSHLSSPLSSPLSSHLASPLSSRRT